MAEIRANNFPDELSKEIGHRMIDLGIGTIREATIAAFECWLEHTKAKTNSGLVPEQQESGLKSNESTDTVPGDAPKSAEFLENYFEKLRQLMNSPAWPALQANLDFFHQAVEAMEENAARDASTRATIERETRARIL